jgi:hypothetical protein
LIDLTGSCGPLLGSDPLDGPPCPGDDGEQVDDLLFACDPVWQLEMRLDRVAVAPALSLSRDVARRLELPDDPVRRALGDADLGADLAKAQTGIAGDTEKDLGVVGEEREPGGGCCRHESRLAFLELDVHRSPRWNGGATGSRLA